MTITAIAIISPVLATMPPSAIEAWPGAPSRRPSAISKGDAQLRAAERPQQQARQPGHRSDPAGQHKPDRKIAEDRKPVHRREKGTRTRHRSVSRPGRCWAAAWVDLIARILERQRGRDPCGAPGGRVASGQRGRDAKAEEEHRRFGRERKRVVGAPSK